MADPTADFFQEIDRHGHEPLLEKASGTLRFDLDRSSGTDHWLVAIDKGDVAVSRRNVRADCVVRLERTVFDGMAQGRVNAMAATLRGDLGAEGDLGLLVLFQRLFPPPPGPRQPHSSGTEASKR
jgi:putative sterol carrier protein